MSKSKCSRNSLIALIAVLLLIAIFGLTMLTKRSPVYSDFLEGEDVSIEYQYIDYMGIHHAGTVVERAKVQNLAGILKRIQASDPERIRKIEERSGAITFMFIVKSGNEKLRYSLKGHYLAVGKRGLLKSYTIYELHQENAEELIAFMRTVFD
jgi:hypothetical protein